MMATRAKTKTKKKFRAVSQKVKLFRSKDPLLSVLMWGVSHTINELSGVNVPVMLMHDDFKAFSKVRVDNHLFNKEKFPSHFKFKEYCPLVFRHLRERFNIDDQEFAATFQVPPVKFASPGRSGAKFYLSQNKEYYVKTLESEEVERMHNILPQYHHYVVEKHGKTLLPQYVAMYRTTVDSKETYMLVMKSVFSKKLKIHRRYDLKGSTVDRQASDKEKNKQNPTFKDNDFTKDNIKLVVGEETKKNLLEILKGDVEFLTSLNIMDYSLLVGIHNCELAGTEDDVDYSSDARVDSNEDSDPESPRDSDSPTDGEPMSDTPPITPPANTDRERTTSFGSADFEEDSVPSWNNRDGFIADSKNEIYYLGIIDVLTYYGPGKKAAHAAKTVKHGAGAEISTVKPENYAKRFLEFIGGILE